ncbi:hypothetical protein [Lonepinella sp. BR2271]|uniref:hypothetical protein n=1 Tax=Lonepinella sp. BR2271 TaxID=3434550 RepID=UPI003F6DD978
MKLRNLFIASAVALLSVVCHAETVDYSGIYKKDNYTITLEKIKDNEYVLTADFKIVKSSTNAFAKENRLYNSKNELIGIFDGNSYTITNSGSVYTKQ